MKKSFLIPELSDWINKLDSTSSLTTVELKSLQDLLVQCRKQLIDMGEELTNLTPEDETSKEFKRQVNSEVQKMLGKLKK